MTPIRAGLLLALACALIAWVAGCSPFPVLTPVATPVWPDAGATGEDTARAMRDGSYLGLAITSRTPGRKVSPVSWGAAPSPRPREASNCSRSINNPRLASADSFSPVSRAQKDRRLLMAGEMENRTRNSGFGMVWLLWR